MAIEVSQSDIQEAEVFLETYLKDAVPEGDFTSGSALRDLCVTPMAHVFALLRKELQSVRARQSVKSLALLPSDEDVDAAVDAVLSNLFISRRAGKPASVNATLYFSRPTTSVISAQTRFYRDGMIFVPAASTDVSIPATSLEAVTVDGTVSEYRVDVLLACSNLGASGNLPGGEFTQVDYFNDYFLRAETTGSAFGGTDSESNADLLARAPTALATRNLINGRSIVTTLLERLPAVSSVTVIGMGDPEMHRDLIDNRSDRLRVHTGGMVDVYVRLPRTRVLETLVVGAAVPRQDRGVVVLRGDASTDFVTSGVQAGQVLNVTAGLTDTRVTKFLISNVTQRELTVKERTPFPEMAAVIYSIGTLSPNYDNLLPARGGQTSNTVAQSNTVVLTGGATYAIRSITYNVGDVKTVLGPDARVNLNPTDGQFQVVVPDHVEAQSDRATVLVYVPGVADNTPLTVTYDSVEGLASVQSLLSNPAEKTSPADMLARAHHPIYVNVGLVYRVTGGAVAPDNGAVIIRASEYIENTNTELSVGVLAADILRAFPVISQISPPTITYQLLCPDGQVFQYETTNLITVTPSEGSGARLTNALALGTSQGNNLATYLAGCGIPLTTSTKTALREKRLEGDRRLAAHLAGLGVSDRTTRYLAGDVTGGRTP